jgi:hypothetical protein
MKKCKTCKQPIRFTERNGLKTYAHKFGYCKANGCLSDYYLNNPEGQAKLNKITVKVTKPKRDLAQAKIDHKNRNKITDVLNSLRNICHLYIRERDKGRPCVACGTPYHKGFHASHYYKAELYSNLRFNEDNIHGGCQRCNLGEEGNLSQYSANLPSRLGQEKFDNLQEMAADYKHHSWKWDREKLLETKAYYTKKLKNLMEFRK